MECFSGRIENCNNSKILVISNKSLTERVKEFSQKISLKINSKGIEILPGGEIHATIAGQRRLRITITNLINKNMIIIENKNKVKIFVNLKKWEISKNKLFSKGKGSSLSKEIPKDLIKKQAAIKKGLRTYYLDISSKSFYDLAKKSTIKCLFNRNEEGIILIKSDEKEARRITPHSKKRIQIAISKEILTEEEIIFLNSKSWMPINIRLNLSSFGLDIKDFFSVREEKELVKYLTKKGIKIKLKNTADPYDFLIENNVAVEIHNSNPEKEDLVTRHKVKPALVRLRILEANFLIQDEKVDKFFIIINKKWETGKYIQEIINPKDKKIKIIFTDFKDKWDEEVGAKIINSLV